MLLNVIIAFEGFPLIFILIKGFPMIYYILKSFPLTAYIIKQSFDKDFKSINKFLLLCYDLQAWILIVYQYVRKRCHEIQYVRSRCHEVISNIFDALLKYVIKWLSYSYTLFNISLIITLLRTYINCMVVA